MKPDYLKMLPNTLKQFSDFLGDRKWFAGDKVYLSINMRGVFTDLNLIDKLGAEFDNLRLFFSKLCIVINMNINYFGCCAEKNLYFLCCAS